MAHTWAVLTSILKVRTQGGFFVGIRVGFLKKDLRFVYFLGVKTGGGNSCRFLDSVIDGYGQCSQNGIIGVWWEETR